MHRDFIRAVAQRLTLSFSAHSSLSDLKCKSFTDNIFYHVFSDVTDMADGTISTDDPPLPPPLPAPPQVRALEDGRDLLTCGQCSRAFPLAHILAFIQHKQGGCRSSRYTPNANATPPSPANRTQQRVTNANLGPGFIELRRGSSRERGWGEEPGIRVKVEPRRAGKEGGEK